MFKNLETWWNARTPVWLHNGTKENIMFQLGATVIIIGAMTAYDEWKYRRELQQIRKNHSEK